MKNSNDTTGNRTHYLPVGSALTQATLPPLTRKNVNYFSAQIYLISVSKLPSFCNDTLTFMIATARRCSTRKLHVGTDCLQQIRLLEVIGPFVLLLRHGYCLLKNIKSLRGVVMLKDKKWNSRSFIYQAKLYVTE
jgi:hypothetical protein